MRRPLLLASMILSALACELSGTGPCRWGPSNPPVVRLPADTRRDASGNPTPSQQHGRRA